MWQEVLIMRQEVLIMWHAPLRMYQSEEDVDAPDESSLDCGEEWPDCEHPDVARYRRFYQVKRDSSH